MKFSILILLSFLATFSGSEINAQSWAWAKSGIGSHNDQPFCCINDGSGNFLIGGYFTSDSLTLGTCTIFNTSSGTQDLFLAKYDPSGNALWAISAIGKTMWEKVNSIVTDINNNIYICGIFSSDTLTIGNTNLINHGPINTDDLFIAKYDSSGNFVWAKGVGSTENDYAVGVEMSSTGELYVTGNYFSESLTFDSQTIVNLNPGQNDIFIVKYDLAGNILWAKDYGGTGNDAVTWIKRDINDDILICGRFTISSLVLDTITLPLVAGNSNLFVAKLDSSGNAIWAWGAGHEQQDYAARMAIDSYNNIYIAGSFTSDSITFGNTTLYQSGPLSLPDIFLAKYDSNGNKIWALSSIGTAQDVIGSVNIDSNNNIYLFGSYGSPSLSFNTLTVNNTTSSGYDIFIAKFDTAGNIGWLSSIGDSLYDFGSSLSVDLSGYIYVTGTFSSPIIQFGSTTLNQSGTLYTYDLYIAKLDITTSIIQQQSNPNILSLYPNPFDNQIMVEGTNEGGEIIILNNAGQIILKEDSKESETSIKTSELSSGFYILRYISNGHSDNFKLVKL